MRGEKQNPRVINKGRLLGAHCSILGGIEKAAERGGALGCSAIQLFTKNSNQWEAAPFTLKEIDAFGEALKKNGIETALAHTGYLINLATVDPEIHSASMKSMRLEIERAKALEMPYIIVHPGSHKEAGEIIGILQLVENLKILLNECGGKPTILLETTSGQGTSLGYSFDHFVEVLARLDWTKDIGICLDTAHIFQAGYDISTEEGYRNTMNEFDEMIGIDYIKVIHINDSKTSLGSRVDRHESVGKGHIGIKAFELLMNDKRFLKIPMVIETPKGTTLEEDKKNLEVLRSLIR